jgi:tetratricopeptide (TPR) repeat protein
VTDALRARLQTSLGSAYTLERELGGGGMSRVFVARDEALGRDVVVKVLAPELAAELNAERFAREIRLAAALQQANIVPVLSAGATSEGLPYYTMPFVEGRSLRQRLERGPLPIAEVLSVLRDVARALAYAHEKGVVHRDVKPDNVLLSGETAVVTDFGIAKAISASRTSPGGEGLTQLGTSIGTPAYMAPEQAAGDPDTDHRADVYAFGCLAYELLAGRPPFQGLAPHKLMVAHLNERPEPVRSLRPDTPDALATLVARCLEKDPDARPQHAVELLQALDAATTSGAGRDAIEVPSRRRVPLGRALALVALVARAAMIVLGLPDWVFPGALAVAALGLPAVLLTWYAQQVQHRAALATPRHTPGGTLAPPRAGTMGTMGALALRAAPHVSWPRAVRWGAAALGAFAALVAAFMTLRALGIGPAGSLLGAGRLEQSARLLVAEFNVPGADSTLGRVVAEAVRTTLGESKVVRVVPASTVSAVLERMRRRADTRVTGAVAREVAQREGIPAVVTGDVASLGGSYVLTVRLVEAATGDEMASAQEAARDANALIPAIDRATRTLRGKIGESLKAVRAAPPLERATTPSLEALRLLTEGRLANGRGDYQAAVALEERAIALDGNFARAYIALSGALANLGVQPLRQDSLRARAYALRERLPTAERLRVESAYYVSGPKALAALESLIVLEPNAADIRTSLGNHHRSRGEFAAAESWYRTAVALDPDRPLLYGNLRNILLRQHRWAAADTVLAQARARGATLHQPDEMFAAYLRGREDSAQLLARAASGSPRSDVAEAGRAVLHSLETLHGRLAAAARLRDAQRVTGARRGSVRPALLDSIGETFRDVWLRGDPPRALRRLSAALRAEPIERIPLGERPYLTVAELYALGGDAAQARRWLARFDAEVRDPAVVRQWRHTRDLARAAIAVLDRRWDDALGAADAAGHDARGDPISDQAAVYFWRGYVHAAAGHTDEAIASFERFQAAPDLYRLAQADANWLAFTHEKLGELYEAKGNAAKAVEHYAAFVALWKDADPELQPRVTEARRRTDRLRARSG